MFCRKCGTEIDMTIMREDGTVVCPCCGAVYRSKSAAQPTKPEQKPATSSVEDRLNTHQAVAPKIMFCKKYGTKLSELDQLDDGSLECPNCGTVYRNKSLNNKVPVMQAKAPDEKAYDGSVVMKHFMNQSL